MTSGKRIWPFMAASVVGCGVLALVSYLSSDQHKSRSYPQPTTGDASKSDGLISKSGMDVRSGVNESKTTPPTDKSESAMAKATFHLPFIGKLSGIVRTDAAKLAGYGKSTVDF